MGPIRGGQRTSPPWDTSKAGKEGAGEGGRERNSHAAAARPHLKGQGSLHGHQASLSAPPWAVFTPWSVNSPALLVDPPVSTWEPTPHSAALHLIWMWWEQPGPPRAPRTGEED